MDKLAAFKYVPKGAKSGRKSCIEPNANTILQPGVKISGFAT